MKPSLAPFLDVFEHFKPSSKYKFLKIFLAIKLWCCLYAGSIIRSYFFKKRLELNLRSIRNVANLSMINKIF